ncbi:MAG: arylsulfotransferase family protein [Rickettsiales bacterium]|nr:arylsulfotransferase family protein [Rickettsiales bacterium]
MGITLGVLQWWPATLYSRAFNAYDAYTRRAREVQDMVDNPFLMERRRAEVIAKFARAQTLNREKSQPGLNVIAVGSHAAMLVNMQGKLLHTWSLPLSKAWPNPPHINTPNPDPLSRFIDFELFPNGDLLVIYHADNDTPYGYGMVKMDKEANVLWTVPLNIHHDMDIAADGRIYALSQRFVESGDSPAMPYYEFPVLEDFIVVISPGGNELASYSIPHALMGTPYEPLLNNEPEAVDSEKHDYVHANSIKVLDARMAAAFPMFKPGQLLVSMRNIDTLAVIDPETGKVVWAARGLWEDQHEAQWLENGHIMVFDNNGYHDGSENKRSRLLEFDPSTGAVAWKFTGVQTRFYSSFHGSQQLLPGGNLLVTESGEGNRVIEITRDGDLVWSYTINPEDFRENPVNMARRYAPEYFTAQFCEAVGC